MSKYELDNVTITQNYKKSEGDKSKKQKNDTPWLGVICVLIVIAIIASVGGG